MEEYSACSILKPDGGAVFFNACILLPILRYILAMATVSSYYPVPMCKIFEDLPHQSCPRCSSTQLVVPDLNLNP